MSEDPSKWFKLFQSNLTDYFRLRLDYYKLYGAERAAAIVAVAVAIIVLIILGFFTYLFLMIAMGIMLSNYFESVLKGFMSIFLFHFVLLLVLWLLRGALIEKPVFNAIINQFLKKLDP